LAQAGNTVLKGQEIAKSGSSGYATGPHLHSEVMENGTPINPMKYFQEQTE